jgi:transcriptional regulator with XRE-family HTH domain
MGGNLAIARKRRRQSMEAWATRLQVSVPTLRRMEKGDPSVAAGVYMTAAWLMNVHLAIASATDPKEDHAALEQEIQAANRRYTPKAKSHV